MNKTGTLVSSRSSLRQFNKSAQVFLKFETCHFSKDESGSATFLNSRIASRSTLAAGQPFPIKIFLPVPKTFFSISCAKCLQRQGERSTLNFFEWRRWFSWLVSTCFTAMDWLESIPCSSWAEELDSYCEQLYGVWRTELSITGCSCSTAATDLWKDGQWDYELPIWLLLRTVYTVYFVKEFYKLFPPIVATLHTLMLVLSPSFSSHYH